MSKNSDTRRVTVVNPCGLHARPSLAVLQTVRHSRSKVEVRMNKQVANAGEILELMSLGAPMARNSS